MASGDKDVVQDGTPPPAAISPVSGDSSRPGTGLMDLLPIPNDTQPVTEPDRMETSLKLQDDATLSHSLATAKDPQSEKGLLQRDQAPAEVRDMGWNAKKQEIAEPLIGGLSNEELWMLVRRFNKQMYHVKAVQYPVPGNLDLNVSDEEEFSPDKLRANLERLYTTVLVNLLAAVKHVARLRSWREQRRTACFCGAYFIAWAFDFVVPLLSATLVTLIAYEPSREVLFPPAPLALVDSSSGGVQKPRAGVLGSHDSATGAPENHKGEAVEQEAQNFVAGIASVALSSAVGKHPQDEDAGGQSSDSEGGGGPDASSGVLVDAAVPDPTALAMGATDARTRASSPGTKPVADADKTKVPVQTALWTKMRPIMHGIAEFTDTWERFGNALSPTPPFPQETYRLRIALLVMPVLISSLLVSSYVFMKGVMFIVGLVFFGEPVITRGVRLLDQIVPGWQKLLEIRNTVLKGVPTNAQLTITLLRLGEANKAPVPPPPRITDAPAEQPAELTDEHLRATAGEPPLSATVEELDDAIQLDPEAKHDTGGRGDVDAAKETRHGKLGGKILGFFKGTSKGGVKSAIGADAVRAKVLGSRLAKDRLGVVRSQPGNGTATAGPVEFSARCAGRRGRVCISATATTPAVAFVVDDHHHPVKKVSRLANITGNNSSAEQKCSDEEDLHAQWTVAVADIVELRKFGGYGWKAKLLVGWSLEREVADGMEIRTSQGMDIRITACSLRDELFNRLVAMGGQKWEAW